MPTKITQKITTESSRAFDDDDGVAEIIFCSFGQCADRTVPCPSCTTIEVKGEDDDA